MSSPALSPRMRGIGTTFLALLIALTILLARKGHVAKLETAHAEVSSASDETSLRIEAAPLHTGVERFGINLSGQTFYDSGQMLKNLVFRNPGFEGETWQSIVRCAGFASDICSLTPAGAQWPAGFLAGAHFEVLSGSSAGASGSLRNNTAEANGKGITLTLDHSPPLAAGDFLLLRADKPGDAGAGWWIEARDGASTSSELHDLSPATQGRQALRVDAAAPGQSASVASYFDSSADRSFLQLRGQYELRFRAKRLAGTGPLRVHVARLDTHRPTEPFFAEDANLTPTWHDFRFTFRAAEDGHALGTVALVFDFMGLSALLDDVSLTPIGGDAGNHTAFRDEVVTTLRELQPGVLRFMDNGTSFGSSLDDLLAPPFARRRAGYSLRENRQEDIPIGLQESLTLAEAIGADPWYVLPAGFSPEEARELMEYLAAPASTRGGAKRAALGHPAPWTPSFRTLHFELGNEVWNAGDFPGEALPDAATYASRADAVFGAMRQSPYFRPERFDLILGGQSGNTWLTGQELSRSTAHTSTDFAPYLFSELDDVSSDEAIFGPMFAEPEQRDTHGDLFASVQAARAGTHPATPTLYEVNLGTVHSTSPAITQSQIDSAVASLGAGIAAADHMLLALRELGITTQCLFALPEYRNGFRADNGPHLSTPLWGAVLDMGGPTNLRRPSFLALQMINHALLPNELRVDLSGANPTWHQPRSANGPVEESNPHLLQIFAFARGNEHSLILLNLSRTEALPIHFAGSIRPEGAVVESRLTSARLTDTNEDRSKVTIASRTVAAFDGSSTYRLPPFSLTTLRWQAFGAAQ